MTTTQVFIAGPRAAGHEKALARLEEAVQAYPKPLRVVTLAPAISGVVWAYTAVCDVVEPVASLAAVS
jgi:hypothetical protein